jgi:cobalamin biosynthetic protein CobC
MNTTRDHGGGIDAAIAKWGGQRQAWLDLSTGINPVPYPVPELPVESWNSLPDRAAQETLEAAARGFWNVPAHLAVIAAPGASALIARMPGLAARGAVAVAQPTYNEHLAAFQASGWRVHDPQAVEGADAWVCVHPNNPDGRLWQARELPASGLCIIDESFCDVTPDETLLAHAGMPGRIVLKSFGKFWGLAGVRLGFAIGLPETVAPLREALGPWPVSGPALHVGAVALNDPVWAQATRVRLSADAARLDRIMADAGVGCIGGTTLFRLYDTVDAACWHDRLCRAHILSRIFPYSARWLRLGLPGTAAGWAQLEAALA